MIESHELGHIVLHHNWTAKGDQYTFKDRLLVPDEDVLQRLDLRLPQKMKQQRIQKESTLKHSPYKDKLDKADCFCGPWLPRLLIRRNCSAHILVTGPRQSLRHMAELMSSAPELKPERVDQIAALPLGARLRSMPGVIESA
jgi:hypothetical protein